MTDLNPCPSCREPLDHPSGDGCTNMAAHKERAVGDDHLVWQLRNSKGWPTLGKAAADRIEALTKERDEQIEWVKRLADDLISAEAKLAKAVEGQKIKALEQILEERGAVFDAMVDAAEDAAGKDVSFNVVVGRALRAAIAEIKGESHE